LGVIMEIAENPGRIGHLMEWMVVYTTLAVVVEAIAKKQTHAPSPFWTKIRRRG